MDLHSKSQHQRFALEALDLASKFSGERGEGQFGWLSLLKAFDYDKENEDVAFNLFANYQQLRGYEPVAYSEIASQPALLQSKSLYSLLPNFNDVRANVKATTREWQAVRDPGPGCTTLAFATAFATWDLSFPQEMNEAIFHSSVQMYKELKRAHPGKSATELNHELWNVQRSRLDRTGTYWGAFQNITNFTSLVRTMRFASQRFLGNTFGVKRAELKASHPLVVWVSVHTRESKHQPHVTMDALVGGVYYVNVPSNAGRLELYDPRGKSPLGLIDPEASPVPPFHRTIGIRPKRNKLVLFPGWLVHSVLRADENIITGAAEQERTEDEDLYRVSLSLNLKGEWQTTAGLSVGCPTYEL